MARPKKQGLDYFPLDVNIDNKIEIIESKYGILGFGFIIRLFQKIYANGYYLEWSQYSALLLKKEIGMSEEDIDEFISFCLEINIFDKTLYSKYNILTSRGIQKRYFTVCKRRKEIEVVKNYLLIKPEEYGVNVDNNLINDDDNTQIEREIESEIEIETESKLLNYTTLNLLFDYLRNEKEKFFELNEVDREVIVFKLKKLELYTKEIRGIPEDKLLELKIQYWVIMEIYLSPYKVYFNKLTREDFIFKFLKVKEYVDYTSGSENDLQHFVGYFIKSLRNKLENEEVRNE